MPSVCCTLLGTDVAVGVGPGLSLVGVGLAEAVSDGVGAVVGFDVGAGVAGGGVRGGVAVVVGVRDGVSVGVGVARHLQETLTEFVGPLKVIVSLAGHVTVEGTVMLTKTRPWGGSIPCAGFNVTPGMPWLLADQLRLLVGLSLLTVTVHCLQVIRLVGETANTPPAGRGDAKAAPAALAPRTSGQNRANALKAMSTKSAQRLRA